MREPADPPRRTDLIDTFQSLLVAFVVAMTFRGFVLEGFMIPTGSMGPTLLGAHVLVRSPVTGYEYVADSMALDGRPRQPLIDPMVSRRIPVELVPREQLVARAAVGDRVLVLKYLWPFMAPQRWDVVVFKNPPDPVGETQNYIKRLVGMPNESLLIVDGDVFVGPPNAATDALRIARKPEMVQRAVWQPVYDSDWRPEDLAKLEQSWRQPWSGPPWKPVEDQSAWQIVGHRAWRHATASPTALEWDLAVWPISDWNAYNAWRITPEYPVSDIRVAAALEVDDPSAFSTRLLLRTRQHRFIVDINARRVELLVVRHEDGREVARSETAWSLRDRFVRLDMWHVDEALRLFVNDREIATLEYDLGSPLKRLELAHVPVERYRVDPVAAQPQGIAELRWEFAGSPVTLHRVRVDRDLYYQPAFQSPHNQVPSNGPIISGHGFGSNIAKPEQLAADHFLMLGDNSAASRDGRVWGRPHPILSREFGFDAPFVVPRSLLVGKAWCVYFPATGRLASGIDGPTADDALNRLPALAPNFGRLRFIR
ncbi:MAG: hypothetical protein KF724_00470 [Phycisphaeraceae bacterium]|nr:hypothetical protein [Phycisphaeraceae bacterium]